MGENSVLFHVLLWWWYFFLVIYIYEREGEYVHVVNIIYVFRSQKIKLQAIPGLVNRPGNWEGTIFFRAALHEQLAFREMESPRYLLERHLLLVHAYAYISLGVRNLGRVRIQDNTIGGLGVQVQILWDL